MTTPSTTPSPGDRVGHFRIEQRLGGGGMGEVFAAVEEGLDRRVALKVISAPLAADPVFRERFTQEARALAALDSAHVVQVFSFGEDAGRLFIATQLVPDGDLQALLDDMPELPLPMALELMAQVAAGLADAHFRGIIHRDIKPANVLLRLRDDDGVLHGYLGDFGVARSLDAETTRGGATVGTPAYQAPELHTGSVADERSDIYSMGCLLWAVLSGRPPYSGESDYALVTAHREQPVPQLAGKDALSSGINRVLRRALAKDPAKRYESAAALRSDLRTLANQAAADPGDGADGAEGAGGADGAGAAATRGERRETTDRLVWLGVAIAVTCAVLAVAGLLQLLGGGGGAPAAKPRGELSQAALETEVRTRVEEMGAFTEVGRPRCSDALGAEAGATARCDLVVDGQASWLRATRGADSTVALVPFLPADEVAAAIQRSAAERGFPSLRAACDTELLGQAGQSITCGLRPARLGSSLEATVTAVDDLQIHFDWQANP